MLSATNPDGPEMLETVKQDPKASTQLLLLAHLYAKTDATSLTWLRKELLRPKYTAKDIAIGTGLGAGAIAGEGQHHCHAVAHQLAIFICPIRTSFQALPLP